MLTAGAVGSGGSCLIKLRRRLRWFVCSGLERPTAGSVLHKTCFEHMTIRLMGNHRVGEAGSSFMLPRSLSLQIIPEEEGNGACAKLIQKAERFGRGHSIGLHTHQYQVTIQSAQRHKTTNSDNTEYLSSVTPAIPSSHPPATCLSCQMISRVDGMDPGRQLGTCQWQPVMSSLADSRHHPYQLHLAAGTLPDLPWSTWVSQGNQHKV